MNEINYILYIIGFVFSSNFVYRRLRNNRRDEAEKRFYENANEEEMKLYEKASKETMIPLDEIMKILGYKS